VLEQLPLAGGVDRAVVAAGDFSRRNLDGFADTALDSDVPAAAYAIFSAPGGGVYGNECRWSSFVFATFAFVPVDTLLHRNKVGGLSNGY
jgi:hypothetical protein